MGDVTPIEANLPHISCQAKCLNCGYHWLGVAPCGVVELECPQCNSMRGVWNNLIVPESVWECSCGSEHFFVSPHAAVCAACGLEQDYG